MIHNKIPCTQFAILDYKGDASNSSAHQDANHNGISAANRRPITSPTNHIADQLYLYPNIYVRIIPQRYKSWMKRKRLNPRPYRCLLQFVCVHRIPCRHTEIFISIHLYIYMYISIWNLSYAPNPRGMV